MASVRPCGADGGRAVPARHGYRGHRPDRKETLEVAGRPVVITNPGKVFFPASGVTKLDMIRYYLSVADGALRGVARRPMVLKRFVHGADGEPFFQKRADRKSTRLNSSHSQISYAVFCLKKKNRETRV